LVRGKKRFLSEEVAVEEPLSIYLNGEHFVTLQASPQMKRELALGHMIAEGHIKSLNEVEEVQVKSQRVNITLNKACNSFPEASQAAVTITTSGQVGPDFLKVLEEVQKPHAAPVAKLGAAKISDMVNKLNERCRVHERTRGTHSAAIFDFDGKLVSFAEDVGRHNAVDKVIGAALLRGEDLTRCALFSSGRQSAYMVLKAVRTHIPVVVSIAHPLESGIRVADKGGVTLIHASRNSIKVYTNAERLIL
jgi:FdhD protein